jgi:hypothetical protein
MAVQNEARHTGEFIMHEGPGHYSRDVVTILSGEGKLSAGQVVGQAAGAVTQSFAGTGNGVLTPDATTPILAGAQIGAYKAVCIEPGANVGTFAVYDPQGVFLGNHVVAGTAFAKEIKFAIADGATDFIAGDAFTINVAAGKWRSADPTNADGSNIAKGILIGAVDATSADASGVALVRGPAEVNGNVLVYDAGVDDAPKKATKVLELKAVGILVR